MTINRTLIIGPSWIGDMVMAQSLFKILKLRDPMLLIDVLAPQWTAQVLAYMDEVSRVIPMPINHGELRLTERYKIAQQLKSSHYQQAIVLPNSFKSALIPWLANIPNRTGYRREMRRLLLNDIRTLDKARHPLMVEQYMALGMRATETLPNTYPYPQFNVTYSKQQTALQQMNLQVVDNPILALCAGAEFGPSKRWPINYYATVAKQKLADGWDVWLFGSHKDRTLTTEIAAQTNDHQRCINLAGCTTLADSIALLSQVSGVISNDSGLMHIAAALQKPLIAIYGSTSPHYTPPLSAHASIIKLNLDCQPCFKRECPLIHHRCMRDLTPDHVLYAIQSWSIK